MILGLEEIELFLDPVAGLTDGEFVGLTGRRRTLKQGKKTENGHYEDKYAETGKGWRWANNLFARVRGRKRRSFPHCPRFLRTRARARDNHGPIKSEINKVSAAISGTGGTFIFSWMNIKRISELIIGFLAQIFYCWFRELIENNSTLFSRNLKFVQVGKAKNRHWILL